VNMSAGRLLLDTETVRGRSSDGRMGSSGVVVASPTQDSRNRVRLGTRTDRRVTCPRSVVVFFLDGVGGVRLAALSSA
jgi:hypothetical protein